MSWQDFKVETWRQKLKQKPRVNAFDWLDPHGLFRLLPYTTQNHTSHGLSPAFPGLSPASPGLDPA